MAKPEFITQFARPFQGTGAELAQLFDPRHVEKVPYADNRLNAVSDDYLKGLVADARKYLFSECSKGVCKDHIVNQDGKYSLTGDAADAMHRAGGGVASLLAYPDVIRLPDTKPERQAFARVMIDSGLHYQGRQTIIAPVCPDYGKGDAFYRAMGGSISPEAQAAINATVALQADYSQFMQPDIVILVADTEDDIDEIMQNIASGEKTVYKAKCESSAVAIREGLAGQTNVNVLTFTQYFGEEFRHYQYQYEALVRNVMGEDDEFAKKVGAIAEQRVPRHSQILGRQEEGYELTVRYMAQYMSLGRLVRNAQEPTLVMNYQTQNRIYFNAFANINKSLRLPDEEGTVIPVLGTIANR